METSGEVPSNLYDHSLAFDRERRKAVLYAGWGGYRDLYEMDRSADQAPGFIFRVNLASAGIAAKEVESINLIVHAGGTGYSTEAGGPGQAVNGAELQAWNAKSGRWEKLKGASHISAEPALLSFGSQSPEEARKYVIERADEIAVMAKPLAGTGNGNEKAGVSLDYVEVPVGYKMGDE